MPYHELEPGDEKFLEQCPICEEGYMVPTIGYWYQCSHCGVEALESEYGVLMFAGNCDEDVEE